MTINLNSITRSWIGFDQKYLKFIKNAKSNQMQHLTTYRARHDENAMEMATVADDTEQLPARAEHAQHISKSIFERSVAVD
jgi:hypothetical protein